jgi:hypothetical protein
VLSAALCLQAFAADSVVLTNGMVLEGQVVGNPRADADVVFATGAKNITIARKEIKELKLDAAARKELAARRAQIAPAPAGNGVTIGPRGSGNAAAAHFELYQWAKAQRLYGAAQEELQATLAADPNHAEAHKALGHAFHDDRWLDLGQQGDGDRDPMDSAAANAASAAAPHAVEPSLAARKVQALRDKIEFYKQVEGYCRTLAPGSSATEKERQTAEAELTREKARAGEMLLACLNPANKADTAARLGALKAIEALKPSDQRTSYSLGASAVTDPASDVRSAAVSLVKARKDDFSIRTMIGHLLASYDDNALVRDAVLHDTAIAGLQALGDKRVYQALLYYATIELRATNVSSGSMTERSIDSFNANNPNGGPQRLSFPIQLPSLTVTQVQTTVVAPAMAALRDVSGQDFGQDWDRWGKWLDKQK